MTEEERFNVGRVRVLNSPHAWDGGGLPRGCGPQQPRVEADHLRGNP